MSIKRKGILLLAKLFEDAWANRLHNPIFLIGCARSGTTLLSELLGKHADIVNWSELNDIWDPTGYPWHQTTHETPPIWIDPVAFTERWWRDTQTRQQELRAILGAYQWLHRKPFILNKSPLNTFRIPYLLEIFPEAKFINMVRDGRAVVYSYTKKQLAKIQESPKPYAEYEINSDFEALAEQLARFWKANIEEVDRQVGERNLIENGQLIEVKYEDLCEDTTNSLEYICTYLGVKMSRFDPSIHAFKIVNQNHKWRQSFDQELIVQITEIMEPTLSNLHPKD